MSAAVLTPDAVRAIDGRLERAGLLDDPAYLRALNFCMLLPGPEAQQLATWCGWRLRGTAGGTERARRGLGRNKSQPRGTHVRPHRDRLRQPG